ncbi:hypothetical protein I552_2678 [Mycobacterium xenopi 3993]|nr:hypothetical protein I552_2678 [Mycobacterium xenopi 3993]
MPIASAAVDGDHRERRQTGPDRLGEPCSTPPAITVAASEPLPCNAITGRKALVWPGGRAIAQLVEIPPRAADTNEPVDIVGAAAGAGSSGGPVPTARRWPRSIRARQPRAATAGRAHRVSAYRSDRRTGAQAQHGPTAQLGHAGHLKCRRMGVYPKGRCGSY